MVYRHCGTWLNHPLSEESSTQVHGHFSSGSRKTHRRRLGVEFGATRLGCAGSTWMNGRRSWGMECFANCASTRLPLEDGSQRCGKYLGASRNTILPTPTYFSPQIWRMFPSIYYHRGYTRKIPAILYQLSSRSSPRYRDPLSKAWSSPWIGIQGCPGVVPGSRSPPSFCAADHHSPNSPPLSHCRMRRWTI